MAKILDSGNAEIPTNRMQFVITLIGKSFQDYFQAFRQYVDNAKDSILKKRKYDPKFEDNHKQIIILLDRDKRSIRIVDLGLSITPIEPIMDTPTGKIIKINGKTIPYINSFKKMAKNLLDSIKQFEDYQSGRNASGMLAFMKLGCKEVHFIVKNPVDQKIYTYILTDAAEYKIEEGGDKIFDEMGVEILLENIDKRIFKNWFNEHRLKSYLQKTYHQDIYQGNININLSFEAGRSNIQGRKRKSPFIIIEPLKIIGEPFDITQIKTKKGRLINLDIKISETPRSEPFIIINCQGTGGVPAQNVLYNPIWNSEYLQGFITADFLNFSGNDKSNFVQDENLEDFQKAIEEKIEEKLAKKISDIKIKKTEERIKKVLDNLKYALYKALKEQHINIEGVVNRTKKCPKCEKILPYNQQICPDCGFEFPHHTKRCKFCKKEIPAASKICPHCKKDLIDTIKCPHCGKEIPKLSYICPECGTKFRDRKEPKGKSPDIYQQSLGVDQPRSTIDKEDEDTENEKLVAIKINTDHEDFKKSIDDGYEQFYFTTLIAKEVAKFQFGKENTDYSEDMIGLLLSMFNELKKINSITYKEK